jgi:DNA-binding transcriptional MerR regulator
MSTEAGTLRSGDVARAAGVNPQTLRYYERRGLLASPARTTGGHRLDPVSAVTTLRVIKAAQRLGFTLDEVADLLAVGRHHHGRGQRPARLRVRAAAQLDEVEARIADLHVIRERLVAALDAGCDDLATCAATETCPIPFTDLAQEHEPART